jgi:hypothetical protein
MRRFSFKAAKSDHRPDYGSLRLRHFVGPLFNVEGTCVDLRRGEQCCCARPKPMARYPTRRSVTRRSTSACRSWTSPNRPAAPRSASTTLRGSRGAFQSAEEDLIILLSASPSQFRSVEDMVQEAAKHAAAGLSGFSREAAAARLARPRRETCQAVDERIHRQFHLLP